ncbi:MAG: AAA family ATPase, partial [Planctomycetaceae bacterium]|nr:AAA family ATPase [Planctomycetaceae bacterium]
MRINDLQVDGFGVWKGLTVDNLNPGMTLFYGRNEAGKTTLMQFVRSAMFGFSSERRDKYSPPVYGGIAGGEVHAITPIGNYVIQRHIDPNRINDEIGDLTVINDEDGTQSGKAQLGSLLANVDESIFNNVFAIGLKEIQELNTLNSTDAAEHLYKLTTGLDRVSLVDVMRTLTQRREAISASSDAQGRLKDLQQKRQVLQREIEDLLTLSRRWTKVAGQSKEATGRLQTLELQLKALERESKVIETATQISERWNQRELIIGQIDQVGILPDESLINLKELSRLNKKISQQKEKMTSVKKQRKAIRKEAFELPINRQLWAQASRIEALGEHLPWIESLERQADRLREQVKTIHSTIGGEVSGMGSTLSLTSKDVRALSNRGFQSLQATSKQLATKEEELSNAFEQLERVKLEKEQIASRVKSASAHLGKGLTREEAAKQVNRLRRRVELEEKVEKLNGARHALERDIDDVVNDQVLPVGKLAVLGAVFVLGVVLAGFGLLNLRWSEGIAGSTATEMGFLLMILGTIFGLFSMGLKHHWERVASDELDDFRHQFDLVRQQLKRAKNERDEIERHIPKGVGEWDLQLRDAESALTRLEDLMPLETHFQTAVANVEESARRFQKLESDQEILQKQWKDNLRALGMPDNIAPNQLS